jgi:hypothetical protein
MIPRELYNQSHQMIPGVAVLRSRSLRQTLGLITTTGLLLASIAFFAIRIAHGIWYIPFGDEIMHLLGGRVLNEGGTLYRSFVEMHGPGIFMLAQWYGAVFGWAHANAARLVPAGLTALAGLAMATSPAMQSVPARFLATALFLGLVASIWLVQGLYLFSYYPVSGAFAAMALAWFVVPSWTAHRLPITAAFAAGVASAMLGFQAYSQIPTALLFALGSCLPAWRSRQAGAALAHLAGGCATALVLFAWLAIWGDIVGYFAFHIAFSQTAYIQFLGISFIGFFSSLALSLQPDHLVQDLGNVSAGLAAILFLALAIRRRSDRLVTITSIVLVAVGVLLLNARAFVIFQNGAFVVTTMAAFALALPMATEAVAPVVGWMAAPASAILCAGLITGAELTARQALGTPVTFTRAEMMKHPHYVLPHRDDDDPYFAEIRKLTKPSERILVLVYRPEIYWQADRLPIDGFYDYLPADAVYAKSPWFGRTRDLCVTLSQSPPPVIIFDNWTVWDKYKPQDYMPCLFDTLAKSYRPVPGFSNDAPLYPKMFVRADRADAAAPAKPPGP